MYGGELTWVDRLILWELGFVAVVSWELALLAVTESGRLRDANPVSQARLAASLGWPGRLTVVLAAAGVLLHLHLALGAMEDLHDGPAGWWELGWWGFWGAAWVVFLLRWFGLSQFRARERQQAEGNRSLRASTVPP